MNGITLMALLRLGIIAMNYQCGWYIDVKYHTLKIPTTRCEGFFIDLKVPSNYNAKKLTFHYTPWNGQPLSIMLAFK